MSKLNHDPFNLDNLAVPDEVQALAQVPAKIRKRRMSGSAAMLRLCHVFVFDAWRMRIRCFGRFHPAAVFFLSCSL